MSDEMPEEIWVSCIELTGDNDSENVYAHVVKTIGMYSTEYRLKSTEDKTIRELAANLKEAKKCLKMYSTGNLCKDYAGKAADSYAITLKTHAPRIAEAQEKIDG